MKMSALSKHLAVFDAPPHIVTEAIRLAPSLDELKEANDLAWRDGFAEGKREGERAVAERIAAMEAAFEERRAAEETRIRKEAFESLAEQMRLGFKALEAELSDAIVDVLEPFVQEQKRRRAAQAFEDCLRDLVNDGVGINIRLDAPPDIIEKLSMQSLFDGRFIDIRSNNGDECQARVDRAIVRARLKSWGDQVVELGRAP